MNFISNLSSGLRSNLLPCQSSFYNNNKFDIIKIIDLISFKYAFPVAIIHQIACHAIIDSAKVSDQEKKRMHKGSFVVINCIAAVVGHLRGLSLPILGVSSVAALALSVFLEMAYQSANAEDEYDLSSVSDNEASQQSDNSDVEESDEAEVTKKNGKKS